MRDVGNTRPVVFYLLAVVLWNEQHEILAQTEDATINVVSIVRRDPSVVDCRCSSASS